MKLVTSSEMRAIDKYAIEKLGIPGVVLMENAGVGLFEIIQEEFDEITDLKVGIVCGKGNNGGDGFVIARHLLNNGANVDIFLLGRYDEVKGDAKINLDILLGAGYKIIELSKESDIKLFSNKCERFDLLVDAIFGTGFSGKITGMPEKIIEDMNKSDVPILAVDIPSGVNADDGSVQGVSVNADFTGYDVFTKKGIISISG